MANEAMDRIPHAFWNFWHFACEAADAIIDAKKFLGSPI
jgi:hypothetical protein